MKKCQKNLRLKSVILHLLSSSYLTYTLHVGVLKNSWGNFVPISNELISQRDMYMYIYIYPNHLIKRLCLSVGLCVCVCHALVLPH